jgi:hypothetical protein
LKEFLNKKKKSLDKNRFFDYFLIMDTFSMEIKSEEVANAEAKNAFAEIMGKVWIDNILSGLGKGQSHAFAFKGQANHVWVTKERERLFSIGDKLFPSYEEAINATWEKLQKNN